MIFIDQGYFGGKGVLQGIFLIPFFFGFDLFGHLAFTITMKLRPGFIDAIPFVSLFVGKITQQDDPLTHGLCKDG